MGGRGGRGGREVCTRMDGAGTDEQEEERMDGGESRRTHAHTHTRTHKRIYMHQGAKRADRRLGGRMARRCGWAHAREQARAWCGGGTRGGHVTRRVGT
jgi:hypothetical protein